MACLPTLVKERSSRKKLDTRLFSKQRQVEAVKECDKCGKKRNLKMHSPWLARRPARPSVMMVCTWKNILRNQDTSRYRLPAINTVKRVTFQKEIAASSGAIKNSPRKVLHLL